MKKALKIMQKHTLKLNTGKGQIEAQNMQKIAKIYYNICNIYSIVLVKWALFGYASVDIFLFLSEMSILLYVVVIVIRLPEVIEKFLLQGFRQIISPNCCKISVHSFSGTKWDRFIFISSLYKSKKHSI